MRNFFINLKMPILLIFFAFYLIKLTVYSFGKLDAIILGIIAVVYILDKICEKVYDIYKMYFKLKEDVISENQFRTKVTVDIEKIVNEISAIKMSTLNPLQHITKRR